MTDWLSKIKEDARARHIALPSRPDTLSPTVTSLTAEEFCQAVLPESGHYCVQVLGAGKGIKQVWATSATGAAERAIKLDGDGSGDVYVAIASFVAPHSRKADKVAGKRSLYLDLDCGEGKPFESRQAAKDALKKFCADSGIAFPSIVVNSGNGMHVHWPLTRDIPPAEWDAMARNLKAACQQRGFAADESCTADVARILRVPGSHNRKDVAKPLPVTGVRLGQAHDPPVLADVLARAAGTGAEISASSRPAEMTGSPPQVLVGRASANNDLTAGLSSSTAWFDARPVDEQIAEIRAMLAALPDATADDRASWIGVLAEINSATSVPIGDRRELAWEFSRRSPKSGNETFETVTHTMESLGDRTSISALRKRARDNGYASRSGVENGRYPTRDAAEIALTTEYLYIEAEDKYLRVLTKQLITKASITELEARRMPVDVGSGRRIDPLLLLRMSPRRHECAKVGFHPGAGPTFMEDTSKVANLFRPLSVAPLNPTWRELRLLVRYRNHLFPRQAAREWFDHLLDTYAYLVQNPGERVAFAMILVGAVEGSGKSTLMEDIPKRLFGQSHVSKPLPSEVESSFTDWLGETWIVVFSEISIGTHREAQKIVNALKDNITSDILRIHGKGHKGRSQANRVSFFGTSNDEANALHLSQHDRRFGVCKTPASRMPSALARELYAFLDSPRGAGVLLSLALNRDTSRFDPHALPPATEARAAMIEASLSPAAGEIVDAWRDQDAPFDKDLVTTNSIRTILATRGIDTKGMSDRRIGNILKQAPINGQRIERQIRVNFPGEHAASKVRLWIVRNVSRWMDASESAIAAHITGKPRGVLPHFSRALGETAPAQAMMTARFANADHLVAGSEVPVNGET